jgi:hypothetical protein
VGRYDQQVVVASAHISSVDSRPHEEPARAEISREHPHREVIARIGGCVCSAAGRATASALEEGVVARDPKAETNYSFGGVSITDTILAAEMW